MGGSPDRADDSFFASAWGLPPHSYGILAMAAGWHGGPLGSTAVCLGSSQGGIARLYVIQADAQGDIAFRVPSSVLYAFPPVGFEATFQFWHRDATPAGSNVTNAYRVRFL